MNDAIFRKFRSKQGEVWQVDCHEAPFWTTPDEGGQPFRPRRVVCRSVRTGRHAMSPEGPGEPGLEMFREVVTRAAQAWRLRPERIEVADSRVAEELGSLLAAEGVPVEVRGDLPELRALLAEWTFSARGAAPPAALSAPGLTVERMAAFAGAAARFAEAAPWRHLDRNEDVLVLEAPGLPEELRCARVLGPPEEGVLFHPEEPEEDFAAGEVWDAEDWEEWEEREEDWDAWEDEDSFSEEGNWKVSLLSPSKVPPEDVELWMRHELPLAHSHAYPVAFRSRMEEGAERPDARLLSWFEAVLAALASTTEEEMDTGRWEKEVVTSEGPVRLGFSLPYVLVPAYADEDLWDEEDDGVPSEVRVADDLATEALEAWGRRQIHLARRAVALWPDCIEGWLVLARRALQPEAARDLYAQAVAAGERLFPGINEQKEPFDRDELRTIFPYLWAREGFAKVLWSLGEREDAVGHFRWILAIDRDHRRIRYLLAHALQALDRNDEAEDLLNRWKEGSPDWWYTRALLTFRQEGDSPAARHQLAVALRADRSVAKQLLDGTQEPLPFDDLHRNDLELEAPVQEAWRETPGALEWLRAQNVALSGAAQARKAKRKTRKKNKKRRR